MNKQKTLKYIIVMFSFLFLLSTIFSFNCIKGEIQIDNDVSCNDYNGYNNIVRLTNGTIVYFLRSNHSTNYDNYIDMYYSTNNGSSWSKVSGIYHYSDTSFYTIDFMSTAITTDNTIYISVCIHSGAGGHLEVLKSTSFSEFQVIEIKSSGVCSSDIAIDDDNNIHVVWAESVGSNEYFKYKYYNDATGYWSDIKTKSTSTAPPLIISCEVATNNDVYMFMHQQEGSNFRYIYYDWSSDQFALSTPITLKTGLAFKLDSYFSTLYYKYPTASDKIFIATDYDGTNSNITLGVFSIDTEIYSELTVFENTGYENNAPVLSVSKDGILTVAWEGTNSGSSNNQIFYKNYNTNTLTVINDTTAITTGNNEHLRPTFLYQYTNNHCLPNNDFFMLYYNDTLNEILYLDSILPSWNDSEEDNDEEGESPDTGNYYCIGGLSINNMEKISTPGTCFEIERNIESSGHFVLLDIYSYSGELTREDRLDDWEHRPRTTVTAYLNGVNIGIPNEIVVLDYDAYYGVYRWQIDQTLSNQKPLIEICTYNGLGSNNRLKLIRGSYGFRDIDNDGRTNGASKSPSPAYCGDNIFYTASQGQEYAYRLCADTPLTDTNPVDIFNNTNIDVYNYIGIHPTYLVPYYNTNSTVTIGWVLDNLESDYQIYVYKDSTVVGQDDGLSPFNIYATAGSLSFIPKQTGFYNVSLVKDNIRIINRTFYVQENPNEYWIYTQPNPSRPLNPFKIVSKFPNTLYEGVIAIFDDVSDITNINNAIWSSNLKEDSITTNYYTPIESKRYYIQMFINKSYGLIPIGSTHTHTCNEFTTQLGSITFSPVNKIVFKDSSGHVEGFHNLFGTQVVLKLNGEIVSDVSYTTEIDKWIKFTYTGTFTLTLEYFNNGTWYVIDTITDIQCGEKTSEEGDETETGNPLRDFMMTLDGETRFLLAIVIIILITLTPYIITLESRKKNINLPDIPYILYGLLFGIGVMVTYSLYLIGAVELFFLLAMLISIMLLIFYTKRGT